jgi:hypothetical protein
LDSGGSGDTLTNLRFADDVVLVAQTHGDIRKMLNAFAARAVKYGLKVNFDKTTILTWSHLATGRSSIKVGSSLVQILAEDEAEKYLGRKVSLNEQHTTELQSRIAAAWASFHRHKGELCSKFYALEDRAKLFEACVTPTAVYGCAVWAMTKKMCQTLDTVRRKMLRYVFRIHRRRAGPDVETWVEYMQRSAKQVDELSAKLGMDTWTTIYRRRKWTFAGKTARRTDHRWSQRILEWKPNFGHGRSRGRPKTRWTDDLEAYAGGAWAEVALNTDLWTCLEDGFVNKLS